MAEIRTITVEQAAERIRQMMEEKISPDTIRRGIQQGVFPFVICIQCEKSPRFIIYERLFEEWTESVAG